MSVQDILLQQAMQDNQNKPDPAVAMGVGGAGSALLGVLSGRGARGTTPRRMLLAPVDASEPWRLRRRMGRRGAAHLGFRDGNPDHRVGGCVQRVRRASGGSGGNL